jgi:hypothetical protein
MVLLNKKSQAMSTETYIAIVVFLSAIVLFYSLFIYSNVDNVSNKEFIFTIEKVKNDEKFNKGFLTNFDESWLISQNCTELKNYFKVKNDFCIFIVDLNDSIQTISNMTHFKYGIGCEGAYFNNGSHNLSCGDLYIN